MLAGGPKIIVTPLSTRITQYESSIAHLLKIKLKHPTDNIYEYSLPRRIYGMNPVLKQTLQQFQ